MVVFACLPDELHVAFLELGKLCRDAFIDTQGALASADEQHDGLFGFDTEVFSGFVTVAVAVDIASQRVAGEVDILFWEPLLQAVVCHTDGFGLLAHVTVGLARVGVLFLDDGGDVEPVGGFQRGAAGESTDTDDGIGLESLQNATGLGQAADELERQGDHRQVFGKAADP